MLREIPRSSGSPCGPGLERTPRGAVATWPRSSYMVIIESSIGNIASGYLIVIKMGISMVNGE